jgi:hypothetical protein
MDKKTYKLRPEYDSHASFYGKAMVVMDGEKRKLYSYDTLVAEIGGGRACVYGTYSATTLRHIKEFLKQAGFRAESKSQIEKDYMRNEERKMTKMICLEGEEDLKERHIYREYCSSEEPSYTGHDGPEYMWASKVAYVRIGGVRLRVPLCHRHFSKLKEGLEG